MTVTVKFDTSTFKKELHKKMMAGYKNAAKYAAEEAKRLSPYKTGKLRKSITSKVITEGQLKIIGYILTQYFVGRFHELGTKKMAARPYLRPAVFNNKAEIMKRIANG